MASAQVLRKKDHLKAGKQLLEEFRKKKAAVQAKKSVSSTQATSSDINEDQINSSSSEVHATPSTKSDGTASISAISAISDVNTNENKDMDATYNNKVYLTQPDADANGAFDEAPLKKTLGSSVWPSGENFGVLGKTNTELELSSTSQNGVSRRSYSEIPAGVETRLSQNFETSSSASSFSDLQTWKPRHERNVSQDYFSQSPQINFSTPHSSFSHLSDTKSNQYTAKDNRWKQNQANSFEADGMDLNGKWNSFLGTSFEKNNSIDMIHGLPNGTSSEKHNSQATVSGVHYGTSNYQDPSKFELTPDPHVRRSRPSFLDSLNLVTHVDTNTRTQLTARQEPFKETVEEAAFNLNNVLKENTNQDTHYIQNPNDYSGYSKNENLDLENLHRSDLSTLNSKKNQMSQQDDLIRPRRDDDFAALEQHIEDLTQEKFSLQRALEASQTLADSLASENSSLTENYNQQRAIVHQHKLELEKLQAEIKEYLSELEAVKIEYATAQLECNAADERAKLLASEVIGLEEKALRLRSNELKLERQLEDMQSEITLQQKKVIMLDKERQDMKFTIDALQEEKKLFQAMLRKGSSSEKPNEISKSSVQKKSVSTNTDDLEATTAASSSTYQDASCAVSNDESMLQCPDELSIYIPEDQMKMIQNINTLILELTLEKEELMIALTSESSECSKLKDINKELSRKLEVQTQRLELLTAKNMVNDGGQLKLLDSHAPPLELPAYADEGDEVVERVLQWIMKLFPGGPARRRTRKSL